MIFMRHLFSLLLLLLAVEVSALDIPKGIFYFDNSKTQYTHVKFVYGSDSRNETYVVSMTYEGDNRWLIAFDEAVTDMYRYTFAETSLADGSIAKTFPVVKDEISNSYNEKRTATTDKTILVGGIFTPETGDNWAQGNWTTLSGVSSYSGTLPVMFINTENNVAITSKEIYVNATYYIDNMGDADVEAIGSVDAPLPLEIRGRGNYTWKDFDKKPYRIKLGAKAPLLGMSNSKHFALLAHADDNLGFLRNTLGFELSRRLGLKFTPAQRPVEVVLNGDYIGLYFLTETVRVAKNRVNITEQPDYTSLADSVSGGWLVEIDNYDDASQVRITEGNGEIIRFTYQSPELLSTAQRDYLTKEMTAINTAIYNTDKNSTFWESYIDMDSLARFYVVQEIMDNAESFHGSCYLHKENGDAKWIFGPVWDFGNSYHRTWQEFIYQNPPFGQTWIGEIAKYPRFQQKVIEVWKNFKGNDYSGLDSFINDFVREIETAAQYDAIRWPNYGNYDMNSRKNEFSEYLENRIDWLVSQWGESGVENIDESSEIQIFSFSPGSVSVTADCSISEIEVYDAAGRVVRKDACVGENWSATLPQGLYIVSVKTPVELKCSKLLIR